MIKNLSKKALEKIPLTREEGLRLSSIEDGRVLELLFEANRLRAAMRGDRVDLCSIVNAKSGACPEDCSYCAQSSGAKSEIKKYPLAEKEVIIEKAREAKASGAKRFCVVISGKRASGAELRKIASMVRGVRDAGLLPCATLGILGVDELRFLSDSGLERYHHNIETSRRFFPEICRTHTYEDKLNTIRAAKSVGLSLCSGGIFGLGEDWEDRVDIALDLRELGADSVPMNFLIPIKGTPLESLDPMAPLEALKTVALFRFMLPEREIRVSGGRVQTLGELNSFVFMAGADGLLIGNYLTTQGRSPSDDLRLIAEFGLRPG